MFRYATTIKTAYVRYFVVHTRLNNIKKIKEKKPRVLAYGRVLVRPAAC